MKNKILVICAHPDDETLGMGGTIALHIQKKDQVFVLVLADGQFGRGRDIKRIEKRRKQAQKACSILGVKKIKFLNYPDQKLDSIPLVEICGKIENVINQFKPDTVYTHYWGDVNQDHRITFEAVLIAARPKPNSSINQLVCFDVPSSTDWGNPFNSYSPNLFINIEKVIEKKIKAFLEYKNEVRNPPHPRSKNGIINRAQYWGYSVGINFAEAFLRIREIKKN